MPDGPLAWKVTRFPEVVDAWVARESPPTEVRVELLNWLMGQREDPYRGMRREPEIPNLWFGRVDGTEHEGSVVTCSYWIYERVRVVQLDLIAKLSLPI